MPYLGRITIAGPEPEMERRQDFVDALSTAMAEGWESLFALVLGKGDVEGQVVDWEVPERKVLDHRIVGYSGGATITAVLDGADLGFEEAAASLASLGRHLTVWSPDLLEYRLERIEISLLKQPWDEDNWLPPLDHPQNR